MLQGLMSNEPRDSASGLILRQRTLRVMELSASGIGFCPLHSAHPTMIHKNWKGWQRNLTGFSQKWYFDNSSKTRSERGYIPVVMCSLSDALSIDISLISLGRSWDPRNVYTYPEVEVSSFPDHRIRTIWLLWGPLEHLNSYMLGEKDSQCRVQGVALNKFC